jgi:hypothetical protein
LDISAMQELLSKSAIDVSVHENALGFVCHAAQAA